MVLRDTWTGREAHVHMNHQKPRDRSRIKQSRARPSEAMGDQRYQELMRGLTHLFLETEHGTQAEMDAERQRVIEEIKAIMKLHGLTTDDLCE